MSRNYRVADFIYVIEKRVKFGLFMFSGELAHQLDPAFSGIFPSCLSALRHFLLLLSFCFHKQYVRNRFECFFTYEHFEAKNKSKKLSANKFEIFHTIDETKKVGDSMKKALIAFLTLAAVFICVWSFKLKSPMTPVDPFASGLSREDPWWKLRPNETPTPDEDWQLDPEIPSNYIPVLGGDELYMVVDENGNIIKYRQRTRQEDGSWVWEDVDPNIPQNYEPVPGLDNVYKVTEADGTIHYYKYVRNPDDTYYFIEVDEHGNPLRDDALSADTIPANYVHVGNNIYAVYNEYGVLVGYKKRVQNKDGSYSWVDCDAPTTTEQYQGGSIPGLQENFLGGGTGTQSNVTVIDSSETTNRGYKEEETYTDTKQEGEWTVVYQTIVTRTYDEFGNLISTKKDGPTEINRFPTSEVNKGILDKATSGK